MFCYKFFLVKIQILIKRVNITNIKKAWSANYLDEIIFWKVAKFFYGYYVRDNFQTRAIGQDGREKIN